MELPIQSGSAWQDARGPRRARGFTLIELMSVMAIIVILIGVAVPFYQKSIIRAKESMLVNNLYTLRTLIDNYSYDKGKAPAQLQDLVSGEYAVPDLADSTTRRPLRKESPED